MSLGSMNKAISFTQLAESFCADILFAISNQCFFADKPKASHSQRKRQGSYDDPAEGWP